MRSIVSIEDVNLQRVSDETSLPAWGPCVCCSIVFSYCCSQVDYRQLKNPIENSGHRVVVGFAWIRLWQFIGLWPV